jgi:hypothetical protein
MDMMNSHTIFPPVSPIKIKIFVWFLHQKVILTKDNLAKCNWNGYKNVFSCDLEESINHLFFACPFAHLIWRVVHLNFGIPPPTNVNMFKNWLNGVEKQTKAWIRVERYGF